MHESTAICERAALTECTEGAELRVLTRKQARALGLSRFWTGKKCRHGHRAERRVADNNCILCHRESNSVHDRTLLGRETQWRKARSPKGREVRKRYAQSPKGRENAYRARHRLTRPLG